MKISVFTLGLLALVISTHAETLSERFMAYLKRPQVEIMRGRIEHVREPKPKYFTIAYNDPWVYYYADWAEPQHAQDLTKQRIITRLNDVFWSSFDKSFMLWTDTGNKEESDPKYVDNYALNSVAGIRGLEVLPLCFGVIPGAIAGNINFRSNSWDSVVSPDTRRVLHPSTNEFGQIDAIDFYTFNKDKMLISAYLALAYTDRTNHLPNKAQIFVVDKTGGKHLTQTIFYDEIIPGTNVNQDLFIANSNKLFSAAKVRDLVTKGARYQSIGNKKARRPYVKLDKHAMEATHQGSEYRTHRKWYFLAIGLSATIFAYLMYKRAR